MRKKKKITAAAVTLGCPKNVVDSEKLISALAAKGVDFVDRIDRADVAIINTCGFIGDAKEESLQTIYDVASLKNSGLKKLVVWGCFSERYKKELFEQIPEVDRFFGVEAFDEISREILGEPAPRAGARTFSLTPPHYAYVKISDGCDRGCSFCAIPAIKGKHRSAPIEAVLADCRAALDAGAKELVLIGQDTTYYGRDLYGEPRIAELLRRVSDIEGAKIVRLMYAYPKGFPDGALDVIAERKNVCNYVDLPLQHVSNRILKSMRRGIDGDGCRRLIEKIRSKIPDAAIRSAFIVGYPGETEEDFEELIQFLKTYEIDRVGAFLYSQEDGTPAFELPDDVPENVKLDRYDRLMRTQAEISYRKNQESIGKSVEAIIDEFDGEFYVGRTYRDAPEIDNAILIKSDKKLTPGDIVSAKVISAEEYDLFCELIPDKK